MVVDPRQGVDIVGVLRRVIQVAVYCVEVTANIATLLGGDLFLLGFEPLDALAPGTESGITWVSPVYLENISPRKFRFCGIFGADTGNVHPVFISLDFFHE